MTTSLKAGLLFVIAATVSGCALFIEHHDDLTKNRKYWGGFKPGETYQLVQDVFCDNRELFSHTHKLRRQYDYHVDANDPYSLIKSLTMTQYRALGIDDKNVPIVTAGTRIRCSRITGFRNVSGGMLTVRGVILDGPLAGTEVSFGDLCIGYYKQQAPKGLVYDVTAPNPDYLKALP